MSIVMPIDSSFLRKTSRLMSLLLPLLILLLFFCQDTLLSCEF